MKITFKLLQRIAEEYGYELERTRAGFFHLSNQNKTPGVECVYTTLTEAKDDIAMIAFAGECPL